MYNRMLVLLDGSKLAEIVLTYARELAGRLSLNLDLLHVCSPEESELLPMRQAYVEHMAEKLRSESEEIRQKAGEPATGKAIEARGKVVVGYPADEILHYAEGNSIDIILMATHGRSGRRQWGLGSVADKVLRASHRPVWLVPAGIPQDVIFDKRPRRIMLIPLDGSIQAESVLPHVEMLSKQRGAATERILVRVCEPSLLTESEYGLVPLKEYGQLPEKWEDYVELEQARNKASCDEYLAGVVRRLSEVGLDSRAVTLRGNPSEELIKYIAQNPPQIIVMATHGRSGISRFTFGSVTERILFSSQVPIFVVRPSDKT